MPEETPPDRSRLAHWGILFVRHGVGWILVIAGIVLLVVSPGGFGVEGFGMATGSGLSILVLNYLYRLGVSGDEERQREEEARAFLAEHGHWPDQAAPAPPPAPESPPHPVPDVQHEHGDPHRDTGSARHPDHGGRRTGLGRDRGPRHRRR